MSWDDTSSEHVSPSMAIQWLCWNFSVAWAFSDCSHRISMRLPFVACNSHKNVGYVFCMLIRIQFWHLFVRSFISFSFKNSFMYVYSRWNANDRASLLMTSTENPISALMFHMRSHSLSWIMKKNELRSLSLSFRFFYLNHILRVKCARDFE